MTGPASWPPGRGAAAYYTGDLRAPGAVVLARDDLAGWSAPLVHFVKHSPGGFDWGKPGPGAADLARSLIIDAIGPAALCPGCGGSRRMLLDATWNGDPSREPSVPYDPDKHADADPLAVTACLCDDGIRPGLPYHDLEYSTVAHWADTWTITRAWLLDELTTFYPPGAVPEWLHDLATGAAP